MLRYNDKLFKRGKVARNHEGEINNCYWYCATAACKASLRYSIDILHPNLDANHDGLYGRNNGLCEINQLFE